MQNQKPLYDDAALAARHRRATRDGLFLHDIAQDELSLRQADVNRTFTKIAVVSNFPSVWETLGADFVPAANTIDFPDTDYDLIVHGMALHQSNDPLGQMIQCRARLKADGLFLAAFLGGTTLTNLRQSLTAAELQVRGGVAPRVHPMIDVRDAGHLMQRAGFALPVADTLCQDISFRDPAHLMKDLRHMGEGNALAQRDRTPVPRGMMAALDALFPRTDGRIIEQFELIFLAGWAPDDSQPKPLRPGSAKMPLADALKLAKDDADD